MLLVSAVVHAALAAVLSQIGVDGDRAARTSSDPPPQPQPQPIDVAIIEAMDVSIIEQQPAAVSDSQEPAARVRRHATDGIAKIRTGATSTGIEQTTEQPIEQTHDGTGITTQQGTSTSLMRMRGPELGIDPNLAERIAESGRAPAPEPKVSGKLTKEPGGKAAIYDTVTTVEIEQDGTAHFHDKPDIDIKFKLPIPSIDIEAMRKDLGTLLTDWYADPYASTRFGRTQDLSNINLAVPGACDSWGSVACDDPLAPARERYAREQKKTGGSLLGGNADISAYLHRKFVGDPYASRKLKLLDDTRDERAKMRSDFRGQQLVRASELVTRNLSRLETAKLSPVEKRTALFELWDECAEATREDEDEIALAGQRARAQVIGWIRSHLPKGSPDGYSDEEIASFNARRSSKQPFEPY